MSLRLVFFGTPEFAAHSLTALLAAGHEVAAVVTAPEKPSGRGMKIVPTPVKACALEHGLPVWQPAKLRDPGFLEQLREARADAFIVVAFRMLPDVVWNMPPMGSINVHASLLPDLRGAAPINWAVMYGDTRTGVTTFRLRHEIDTGDMLLQDDVDILPEDDAGSLYEKLMRDGAALLVRTLQGLETRTIVPQPQRETTELRHAPKLTKETMRIDWSDTAVHVHNKIRGLSPYPGAWTDLEGKTLKIFRSSMRVGETGAEPGRFDSDQRTYLRVSAADGWIYIEELQLEGKKRMSAAEFLRGFRFQQIA